MTWSNLFHILSWKQLIQIWFVEIDPSHGKISIESTNCVYTSVNRCLADVKLSDTKIETTRQSQRENIYLFAKDEKVNKINGKEWINIYSQNLFQSHSERLNFVTKPTPLPCLKNIQFDGSVKEKKTNWFAKSETSSCNSHSEDKIVQNSNTVTGSIFGAESNWFKLGS